MKFACRYSIVRFVPYPETGEFVNVGVVLICPTSRFVGFRLTERVTRITAFFEELDPNIVRKARKAYAMELERIVQSIERAFGESSKGSSVEFANFVFSELVRPRDGVIVAQGDRAVMSDVDPREKLGELFDRYVGRTFATKAYQERNVEKRIHNMLRAADLTTLYRERLLGQNDAYKARMKFVHTDSHGDAVRAIKPIFLAHEDPSHLYDHGWEWIGKITKLRRDKALKGAVLFAAEAPEENFGSRASAFAEVSQQLAENDIQLARDSERDRIVAFASGIPDKETADSD